MIVRPETVLRWHRKGWWLIRLEVAGKDRAATSLRRRHRPNFGREPALGHRADRGELLELGVVVSNRSIRRYRWRRPRPESSQALRTFLKKYLNLIWAADLFVVQTISYQVLYVMFLISHDRRELLHFNVTSNPTTPWVWPQLIEAPPWGN